MWKDKAKRRETTVVGRRKEEEMTRKGGQGRTKGRKRGKKEKCTGRK